MHANLVDDHLDPLRAKAELGSLYSTYCGRNNKTLFEVGDSCCYYKRLCIKRYVHIIGQLGWIIL